MLKCPYEDERRGDLIVNGITMESGSRCHILMVATGFIVRCGAGNCRLCIKNKEWNASGVEHLEPDAIPRVPTQAIAEAVVAQSGYFSRNFIDALRTRLISGDCPRYQASNPVDIRSAFGKFAAISGRYGQAELIQNMLRHQVDIPEDKGGHSPEELDNRLRTLAREFGIEDAYDEEVNRIAAAVGLEDDSGGTLEPSIAG